MLAKEKHERDIAEALSKYNHECLAAFPFLKGSFADLKKEFYLYVAKAADVNIDSHGEILKWWKQNVTNLPKWSTAAQNVSWFSHHLPLQNVLFLLLKASFKGQQELALQDYMQASLMLVQWALSLCD